MGVTHVGVQCGAVGPDLDAEDAVGVLEVGSEGVGKAADLAGVAAAPARAGAYSQELGEGFARVVLRAAGAIAPPRPGSVIRVAYGPGFATPYRWTTRPS